MADQYERVANTADIPAGSFSCFTVNGKKVLVANVEGTYYATDELCTHEDASLANGALHGDCISCPLHGSRFNLRTGEPMEEPADIPLRTYPVKISDGAIFVDI